jgi:hypothetical protein
MNLKELVSAVSSETSMSASSVKIITSSVLEKLANLIDAQDKFVSSIVTIQSITVPARPAEGDKPAREERKVGRIQRRKAKAS